MGNYKLSEMLEKQHIAQDGSFAQTQFSNTLMPASLCYAASKFYLQQAMENENISCIITTPELSSINSSKGFVLVENPEEIFYKLHNQIFQEGLMHPQMKFGIDPSAKIHETAVVSDKVWIGKNVEICANTIIEPFSHLADNTFIGPGAIIGACGHYYKRFADKLFNVQHAGGVWLENGVQVLAGAIISKSIHCDFTTIGEESIISVHAHVGHGSSVGKRCTIAGNVQISGYAKLGNDVWVGPSATIGNLRVIGNEAKIETGSVVVKDVAAGERVSGHFAVPHHKNLRDFARRVKDD